MAHSHLKPKTRVVSGMRPTGRLHLGHYHGVLQNWLALQNDYDCFFFIADWHALTTEYADPAVVKQATQDVLVDWLAAGIDPDKTTLFVQSDIKEHAELHLLLSMITPLGWLERVPSYKEMQQELATKDLSTYGFLGYPLLQTADIAMYNGERVPVGSDQVAHIELSREVVRRFNFLYAKKSPLFKEPQPLLTPAPKLLGPDRRKMSKSYGNALYLSDPPETIRKQIMAAITDPARVRRSDPGNPDICLIYDYHRLYTDPARVKQIDAACRSAAIGCVDCKKIMLEGMLRLVTELGERRKELLAKPKKLAEILAAGRDRARREAAAMMERVRAAMGLS